MKLHNALFLTLVFVFMHRVHVDAQENDPCKSFGEYIRTITDDQAKSITEINCDSTSANTDIPSEIARLTELTKLRCSYCSLFGKLPSEISQLTKLQTLNLAGNTLSGVLVFDLGKFPDLEVLNLGFNQFEGGFDSITGTSSSLALLRLGSNKFDGPFTFNVDRYPSVKELHVTLNGFSGEPQMLGPFPVLEKLMLAENAFEGFATLRNTDFPALLEVDILDNRFSGALAVNGIFSSLTSLRLGKNEFTGSLDLAQFPVLQRLDVSNNQFSGTLELKNMPDLTEALLSENDFSGSVNLISSETPNLEIVRLDNCLLNGNVIVSGSFPNFQELRLDYNGLTGELYMEGDNFPALQVLRLNNNGLTGAKPTNGTWNMLQTLELQYNNFTGVSVLEGSYPMLTSLDISHNKLGGKPTINLDIMPLLQRLFMSDNTFTNTLLTLINLEDSGSDTTSTTHPFKSIGTGNSFRESDSLRIDVNSDSLTAALSDLDSLDPSVIKALHLGNTFNGSSIPAYLSRFSELTELDLRANNLTSTLPISIERLTNLQVINLHKNFLDPSDTRSSVESEIVCPHGTADKFDPDEMSGRSAIERCVPCAAGTFQKYIGELECDPCEFGHYAPTAESTECLKCVDGTVTQVRTKCEQCTKNTFLNEETGQCDACPEETPVSTRGGECEKCADGSVFDSGKEECVKCAAGERQSGSECVECTGQEYTSVVGEKVCQFCEGRVIRDEVGTTAPQCTDCERNYWFGTSNSCEPCPAETPVSNPPGACSACKDGTFLSEESGICEDCPRDSFRGPSQTICETCPEGFVTAKKGSTLASECVSPAGLLTTSGGTIVACPVGGLCESVGTTIDTMRLSPGYWRTNNESFVIYSCPGSNSTCQGSRYPTDEDYDPDRAFESDQYCSPTRTGVFCVACIQGYAERGDRKECEKCEVTNIEEDAANVGMWSGIFGGLTVLALLVAAVAKLMQDYDPPKDEFEVTHNPDGSVGLPQRKRKRRKSIFTIGWFYRNVDLVSELKEIIAGKGRILLGFVQVLSAINSLFGSTSNRPFIVSALTTGVGSSGTGTAISTSTITKMIPVEITNLVESLSVLTLDLWILTSGGCAMPSGHGTLLVLSSCVSFSFIIAVVFSFGLVYNLSGCFCCRWRRRAAKEKRKNAVMTGENVVTEIKNERSYREERKIIYKSLKKTALTLTCFVLFMVYPSVGRIATQTFDCETLDGTRALRADYSVICGSDYHQLLLAIAFAAIGVYVIGVPVFFSLLLIYKADVPFLSNKYRTKYRWFEVEQLVVKLFQTTIIVVIFSGQTTLQVGYFLLVTMVAVGTLFNLWPFKLYTENVLAILVQGSLFVIVIIGLIYSEVTDDGSTETSRTIVVVIMGIALVSPFAYAVYTTITDVHEWRLRSEDKTYWSWDEKAALQVMQDMLADDNVDAEKVIDSVRMLTDVVDSRKDSVYTSGHRGSSVSTWGGGSMDNPGHGRDGGRGGGGEAEYEETRVVDMHNGVTNGGTVSEIVEYDDGEEGHHGDDDDGGEYDERVVVEYEDGTVVEYENGAYDYDAEAGEHGEHMEHHEYVEHGDVAYEGEGVDESTAAEVAAIDEAVATKALLADATDALSDEFDKETDVKGTQVTLT